MNAIRVRQFGGPDVMQVESVDLPGPSHGQVLVRIRAAGVNPVDTYIRSGTYATSPPLPYTPGMDGAGEVAAIGPGVTDLAVGTAVYVAGSLTGTYAEQALCMRYQVHALPPRIDSDQDAALGVPYATAYRALFHKAGARAGQTVLIHGASGGVGIAAVQMARAAGMTVIATAGSDKGRDVVLAQGAHHCLDHSDPGRIEAIRGITSGKGVDAVIEMLANVNLVADLQVLAQGGTVVVVGNRGTIEINPRVLMAKEATVRGMVLMNASVQEVSGIHEAILAGLENGSLRPVISRQFRLDEAPQAHEAVMASGHCGKVILAWAGATRQ